MKGKALSTIFIIIAVVMAIAVTLMTPEQAMKLLPVSRFFDVMIPVLAVGALFKYLACCPHHHHCDKEHKM